MQIVGYILFLIFVYPLSFLPKKIIYLLSNFLAFILQKVIKYRSDLITKNLQLCFPNKTEGEIERIKKQTYLNLADIIFESISFFNFKKQNYINAYNLINENVIDVYFKANKSVIVVSPHIGNWEGATSIDCQIKHQLIGMYKPLRNKFLDKAFKKRREKFGCIMESIKATAKCFEKHKSKNCIYVMISDQSPSNASKAFITQFLNRKTAFLKGPAKYAKLYNYPIVAFSIIRDDVQRGKYNCTLNKLVEKPLETSEDEILKTIANFYEDEIKKQPHLWLWSHNRWKKDLSKY